MKAKLVSIAKGAALAGVGAMATYATQALSGQDFGVWTPILAGAYAILANAARLFTPETAATTAPSPPAAPPAAKAL